MYVLIGEVFTPPEVGPSIGQPALKLVPNIMEILS